MLKAIFISPAIVAPVFRSIISIRLPSRPAGTTSPTIVVCPPAVRTPLTSVFEVAERAGHAECIKELQQQTNVEEGYKPSTQKVRSHEEFPGADAGYRPPVKEVAQHDVFPVDECEGEVRGGQDERKRREEDAAVVTVSWMMLCEKALLKKKSIN